MEAIKKVLRRGSRSTPYEHHDKPKPPAQGDSHEEAISEVTGVAVPTPDAGAAPAVTASTLAPAPVGETAAVDTKPGPPLPKSKDDKPQRPERPKPDLNKAPGYKASDVVPTPTGLSAKLTLAGEPFNAYSEDTKDLSLEVEYQSANRLHVHVFDAARKQFQMPERSFARPTTSASAAICDLEFSHQENPFSFTVSRKSSNTILFDTTRHPLIYSEQFLYLATTLAPHANIYGPGEVISSSGFKRAAGDRTTLWCRDDGTPQDENIYGVHPFYLSVSYTGDEPTCHGVFLLNTHGMDIRQSETDMSYSILGGTLDFYFLSGPSPMSVIRQYSEIVGRPARMPYWAFGLHMCRWAGDWTTPESTMGVVKKMREANIPLETIWSDLDYMDRYRNFDSNKDWSHDKYRAFVKFLHGNKQKYIPIVDAAIAKPDPKKNDPYIGYDRGKELDVFVKVDGGKEWVGEVWPGDTVFPDWSAPNVQQYWKDCLDHYRAFAEYDGIWLDMNEPASFGVGLDREGDLNNRWDFPKYQIENGYPNFWDKTISPSATLADGYRHYNEHNIYAHQESHATKQVLLEQIPGKRPFIITRSNFAGTGSVAGHWLGDNYSTWESMRDSIQGVFQYQMFQIPMVGPDSCGFAGDVTEELANRWMQLGAFYPFYRNHNVEKAAPQEPYVWKSVAEASRKVLRTRYQLLPYWETLFAQASRDGTPVIRPLFFEFDDARTLKYEEQFLVGSSLLVTPVLYEGKEEVAGYFPEAGGVWRDWYTFKPLELDNHKRATLPTPLGSINVHIRPGSAILIHNEPAYSMTDTKSADYGLIVSLDAQGKAAGTAVIDDGISVESAITEVAFAATARSVTITGTGAFAAPALTHITVLGVSANPEKVAGTGTEVVSHTWKDDVLRLMLSVNLQSKTVVAW